MIDRIRIRGFKPFGPSGVDLALAPITLLLGENSVGKSSLFQMLLALQQSWDEFGAVARFSAVGPSVDLGRFSNVQHRLGDYVFSEVGLSVEEAGHSIEFCWHDGKQAVISPKDHEIVAPPDLWPDSWREFQISDSGTLKKLIAGRFCFLVEMEGPRLRLILSGESILAWLEEYDDATVRNGMDAGAKFVWIIEAGEQGRLEPALERTPRGLDNDANLEEVEARKELDNEAFSKLSDLVYDAATGDFLWTQATRALEGVGRLRARIRSMCHIGGIRHRGKRLYEVRSGDNPWSVGVSGERMVDLLVHHPSALELTNILLERAKAGYRIRIEDPETRAQVRELLLEDVRDGYGVGNAVGLPDVGTGISQLLPIAVQIAVFMQAETFRIDPLLLVEQPELHLHPRLQAHLVNMLVSAVTLDAADEMREGNARPVQFIIETHSEHLVRALALQVEQGSIAPHAVSLIKMTRDSMGRIFVKRIRLGRDGRFHDTWPSGFFPERERLEDGQMP